MLCGFIDFDWVQTVVHQPDPNPFSALNMDVVASMGQVNGTMIPIKLGGKFRPSVAGTVKITAAMAPYNDPPQGGGYTYQGAADYSYPFYCYVLGDGACAKTNTTLSMEDTPSNPCLVDALGNASATYMNSAATRASCGNKTAAKGEYTGFTTHLAGVKFDGTAKDLGIGFGWKANFNGTAGGINTNKNTAGPDPGTGTGGVTVVSYSGDTNYGFNGFGVIGINGSSSSQTLLDQGQVSVTTSGLAYSRVTQTYNGTITLTNTTDTAISAPIELVFTLLTTNVSLESPAGMFGGFPYLSVINDLGAGQSISVPVQFSNPSNGPINLSPTVYSGSFE